MKCRNTIVLPALLACVLAALPAAWGANEVPYVAGGVGEESLALMREESKRFNLKLVFALKDGQYLAGVAVAIFDARGVKLLDATADGPWLLAQLAPGTYRVTATNDGEALTQAATVPAGGRCEIVFRWAPPK